jgi:glycosyltransferase involved in cell wall biosynthesis
MGIAGTASLGDGSQRKMVDGRAPVVSIGLPVYNGGRFLTQALDSMLGQSFQDVELIISDNASTDETAAICQAYALRDPRVRYIRQAENIGAPRNWNFVAEQARGKYFKWSTANDFCADSMLEKCVAAMECDSRIVLCHGKTCLVDEETDRREEYQHDIATTDPRPSERFKKICRELALNNAQSGLFRLHVLRHTHLDRPYPGGDLALMAELALYGHIVLLPEVLFYRRIGRESFSSLLSRSELQAFFDPQSRQRPGFNQIRLHLDYLRTVALAPISAFEKLCTLKLVFRHAVWDRNNLWAELLGGLRRSSAYPRGR